ncbi:MAG TPA: FAD-binding oxidoreductase [Gemmatimonadaceae bacterium]|nr:FAD-binding oxidoreductase [Gemmatimonadaceae bacterium]
MSSASADTNADVVIVGAGIAGVAAAYHLAVRHRVGRVVIVDEREPLTLTSDKGTAGYRNWWPGPDATMLRYMTRSIDLLEEIADESSNAIRLSRHGYLFVTGLDDGVERLRETARAVSAFGMGPLRTHPGGDGPYVRAPAEGYRDRPIGADLLLGGEALRAFPYLAPDVKGALHVRRAGWVNPVALGSWLLERALTAGARFVRDRVTSIVVDSGRALGVRTATGTTVHADRVVIAAGPMLAELGHMLGLELPVLHELHARVTLRDPLQTVDRGAPFLIWTDPMELPWTAEERTRLAAKPKTRRLLEPYPGGVHVRPVDGPYGDELYFVWTFHNEPAEFVWPPQFDGQHGEVVLRGAARMIPALHAYFGTGALGVVDGGYYCKTPENRPLIGPLPVDGAYVLGALSGVGVMGAHAGADLLAAHVTGGPLPEYARWFLPSRYEDSAYRALVRRWGALVGQL